MKEYFKDVGRINKVSTREVVHFEVTKLDNLINVIIPHFDKYPLQSVKSID